jgi:amidase
MVEIWRKSASEIAAMVRGRKVSAHEVTKAHLARLEAVNPALNAVVQHMPDAALKAARDIDARLAKGEDVGPLAGVPVTIKVNVDMKGYATTNGLRLQKDLIASADSPVTRNLKAAGAVIVGRTNTPAFSLRWFTNNRLHGHTFNPHDKAITPGGSSGGAASAVASGICALGHGTDIGGSIRYPAYACGLQGLRPTLGRIAAWNPSAPDRFIGGQLMAVSGPIARSIADIRLGLAAMSATGAGDPWWVPAPLDLEDFPRRVALCVAPDGMNVASEVEAALRHSASALADAGWQVEEIDCPSFLEPAEINAKLWMAEMRRVIPVIEREADEAALFVFGEMTKRSPAVDLDGLQDALQMRVGLLRDWQDFLARYPVVLCPVSGELPFADQDDLTSPARFEEIMQAQLTQLGLPALGLPGLSVATGFAGSTPVGVQLVADRYREDVLLEAGAVIEAAMHQPQVVDPAW